MESSALQDNNPMSHPIVCVAGRVRIEAMRGDSTENSTVSKIRDDSEGDNSMSCRVVGAANEAQSHVL